MKGVKKVPGYAIILIAVSLAALVFSYFITIPYVSTKDSMELQHQTNLRQINKYETYYKNIDKHIQNISDLKSKWTKMQDDNTVDPRTVTRDIKNLFAKIGVDGEVKVSSPNKHESITSSTGRMLYDIPVSLGATMSRDKVLSMLSYLERESNGTYQVNTISIKVLEKDTVQGKYSFPKGDYQMTMLCNLYYFQRI